MMCTRRNFGILVAAGLSTSVTGCGGTSAGDSPGPVGYLATSKTNIPSTAMAAGFQFGVAGVSDITETVVAPEADDAAKQLILLESLVKTSTGGFAYSASAPVDLVETLAAATKRGTPVIAVDVAPPMGSGVDLFVGNDSHALGTMLADLVIDQLPADATGKVVLANPRPGLPVLDLRALAIRQQFAKRLPEVKVAGPFDVSVQVTSREKAWTQLARANPAALAMISVGADGKVLTKVRIATKGSWKAAAFDIDPISLAAVKKGDLLLVSPEQFLKGAVAGRLIALAAAGKKTLPQGWVYTGGFALTAANADTIIAREATDASKASWFQPALDKEFAGDGPQVRPLSKVQ
jgi:ribose transport system substrate-binding protein